LNKIIRYNVVKYIESEKREYINFKIHIKTINILLKRQLIDRSCKDAIKNKFNLDLVYTNLDLAYTNLDLAYINLDLAYTNLDLAQNSLDLV